MTDVQELENPITCDSDIAELARMAQFASMEGVGFAVNTAAHEILTRMEMRDYADAQAKNIGELIAAGKIDEAIELTTKTLKTMEDR